MSNYILALDQGTTSSRAILFDRGGNIHARAQQEFRQMFPQPGWVEQDPDEIWQSQLAVAKQALKNGQVSASEVAAIGIANQRETTIIWNRRTGEPIANAIVWQDRRTAVSCETLRANGHAAVFQEKTGLVLDAYFSGTKIQWLLDKIPDARAQAERGELAFGTIDSWLTFKLCGEHVTDISNVSRTLLFNIHTLQWDQELLSLLQIPEALLPDVVASSGVVGHCHEALFGSRIAIAGIAGDQQASTFGQACYQAGMAKNTYGTGCFMLMNTGTKAISSHNNLLTTIGWSRKTDVSDTNYMLEGSVFMAGATVQWLRDALGIIQHASEIEELATSVPDTGNVILVPAFAGLGAPYWDPHARAALFGMTRGTTKAHIARAALESIAYQTADVLHAMQMDSGIELQQLRVDGGAACNNFLMQFQADILGVPLSRPVVTETTALGAAYLAGLAVNFWSSLEELNSHWKQDREFLPAMSESARARHMEIWQRGIAHARSWAQAAGAVVGG